MDRINSEYKISIRVVRVLCLFFLILNLGSCNSTNKNNTPEKATKPQAVQVRKKTIKHPEKEKKKSSIKTLNDETAESFLKDYGNNHKEQFVDIDTKFGKIKIRLYDQTPLHRANFLYLVNNGFYNNTEFYRVIPDFMIQAGRTDDEEVYRRRKIFGYYTLSSEFRPNLFHKRGALAMGRDYDDNPEKRSSSYDFYIVCGGPLSEMQLNATANMENITIPADHRKVYKTLGGTPHLDQSHTVFGEVVEGMNVVDSIANVRTDKGDWPIQAIKINLKAY